MNLHSLLSDFVKSRGRDILKSPLLCNIMDDELMFYPYEHRHYKMLFRLMVKKGYVNSVVALSTWNISTIESIRCQIANEYNGTADILYALQCLGHALGLLNSVEEPVDVSGAKSISQEITLGDKVVKYIAHGSTKCIGTMIPASMATAIHNHLNAIAKEEGSVAEFVMNELHINTQEELEAKLSGEQIDGVALAIKQMQDGKGFIIGDMTGVGKGRQVAACLYWAILQGTKPVFVTEKSTLFTDLYRDLKDIGCGHLRPFILNSDSEARILDSFGNIVYDKPKATEIEEFKATRSIPVGYDFLLLTYSQLSREADKNWKADCVKSSVKDSYLIMDESHNATGSDSNIGQFFREAVTLASGVCFASATFAKYPSSMPVYALKTAMGDANIPSAQLIEIIENGGPILQEVMSKALVESGSMIRRQRDMSAVERNMYSMSNPNEIDRMREKYNMLIDLIEEVHMFQKLFINNYLKEQDVKQIIKSSHKIGPKERFEPKESGIIYQPFSSRMTPLIRQLLFAIKTEEAIDATISELKQEHKPIVQISRTMESTQSQIMTVGESYDHVDFAQLLSAYLKSMFSFKVKGTFTTGSGKTLKKKVYRVEVEFDFRELESFFGGNYAEEEFNNLLDKIMTTDTTLPISPIDYFVQSLTKRGYRVGELTHRKMMYLYDDISNGVGSSGKYTFRNKVGKKRVASDFNAGNLDVLIGNRVMASGISLHNSPDFADQRPRTVITWEQQDSADRQTQFDGRADRTGQLTHCKFITLFSPIPAEHRFMMMNERKMRSLNANVEANQYSADSSCLDIINKYGSQVVNEYLSDNPDRKYLFEFNNSWYEKPDDYIVKEFMRGLALLNCEEQQNVMDEILKRYTELIKQLDEDGINDLKNKVMPLNASLLNSYQFYPGKKSSDSTFSQDAKLDEVEMNVLRKPLTSAQISMLMGKLSDGDDFQPIVDKYYSDRELVIRNKYTMLVKNTNSQIANLLKLPSSPMLAQKIEKLNERINKYNDSELIKAVKDEHDEICNILSWFRKGQSVGVPMSLEADSQIDNPRNIDYVSVGIFLGFKMTRKQATKSSIKAVFAVNDYRCKIELPLSDVDKLRTIREQTSLGILSSKLANTSLASWDSIVGNHTRTRGYIVTGNILLGIAMSKHFGNNIGDIKERRLAIDKGRGQLITYTDDKGGLHHGYLLPPIFRNGDQKLYLNA